MLQIIYLLFATSLSGTRRVSALSGSDLSSGFLYQRQHALSVPENLHVVFSGSLSNSEASVCPAAFSHLQILISLQAESLFIRRKRLFRPPTGFIFLFWIFLYKSHLASGESFY